MSISNAVERKTEQDGKRQTVAGLVNSMGTELQRALPAHLSGERVARIAMTLIRQSDMSYSQHKLSACTPESFVAALMTSCAIGLEPGVNGESYLIPYKQECTLVVGYQGMTKLAWQHPIMQNIGSGFVWPEDEFDYDEGMDPHLHHKPAKGIKRDSKAFPDLYYSWATLKTGGKALKVLDHAEVTALRQGKQGADPKFKGGDPQFWMGRKTSLRQLLKPLPKSVQAHWATQVDEQTGGQLYAQQIPAQIAEQVEAPVEQAPERPAIASDPGPLSPEVEAQQYANAQQAAQQPDPWES